MKRTFVIFVLLTMLSAMIVVPVSADPEYESFLVLGEDDQLPPGWEAEVAALGGDVLRSMPEIGIAVVKFDNPYQARRLSRLAGIQSVVPNLRLHWIGPIEKVALGDYGNPPVSGDDDFFFDLQWGHDAVDAPEAWEKGGFGEGVRVAVLDDGIDSDHPDLAPNLNVALSTSFVPGEPFEYLENYPGDPFSHGSHVAGTIAAADNGYGTIGVAPEAEIVMVKVLSSYTGSGDFDWVINGILYAADIGADIINMSLGATIDLTEEDPFEVLELYQALARATRYAHNHGVTIITSAGNSAIDADSENVLILPSQAPHTISVSATAPYGWAYDFTADLDDFAHYSNYGESLIDLAAPGGDWDLVYDDPSSQCQVSFIVRPCFVFDFVFSTGSDGAWYWGSGTSMSAPHVSGVAAIIISEFGGSLDPNKVAYLLGYTADDLGDPGKDAFYGWGRVNANNFMMLFP